MAQTQLRGNQVLDGSVQRQDLDAVTAGSAVIRKVIQGTNIVLSSTGPDAGTGDVTISAPSVALDAAVVHLAGTETITGAKTFSAAPIVSGAAGSSRNVQFATAGVLRWAHGAGSGTEAGANAGSDYFINRHDDATGAFLSTPISISRATGVVTVNHPLQLLNSSQLILNGASATPRYIEWETGGAKRWQLRANNTADAANAGSDFDLLRYDDAGTGTSAMLIARASGAVTFTSTLTVTNSTAASIVTNGPAGTVRGYYMQGSAGAGNRWAMVANQTGESTGNVGSDWALVRYDDAGATLSTPLAVIRSSGQFNVAHAMQVAGTATFNAAVTLGNAAQLSLNAATPAVRTVAWQTAGVNRWSMQVDATAEGGAAAGSNFAFLRHDDAGTTLGTVISIVRSTGNITIGPNVSFNSQPTFVNGFIVSTLTGYIKGNGASAASAAATIPFGDLTGVAAASHSHVVGDVSGAATDALVAHLAGTETITGAKTFSAATVFNALVYNSSNAAVAAAGTTQGTATALTASYNVVTSATAGTATGVALPAPAQAGALETIVNRTAVTLNVYPASGGTIEGLAANTPVTLPGFCSIGLKSSSTTNWFITEDPLPDIVVDQRLTANFTTTSATAVNVFTGITTEANAVYRVRFKGVTQCSAASGNKFQLTAPTGATVEGMHLGTGAAISTPLNQRVNAINTLQATASNTAIAVPAPIEIEVVVVCGATTGTLTIGGAVVTATTTTATVFANSTLKIERIA